MFDWSPLADALRLGEFKLRLLAELLSRLRAGTWRLIWLHPTQGAKPFLADLLAELTLDNFDIKKSELILGGWRYHVRVEQIDPDHDQPAPSGDDKPKPKRHRTRPTRSCDQGDAGRSGVPPVFATGSAEERQGADRDLPYLTQHVRTGSCGGFGDVQQVQLTFNEH
jgi:hypothetical protein